MAGHSAYANIKHRKAAQDKRRSKLFTKVVKEIYVAVKEGGPDPNGNPRLSMALRNARKVSVPRENIEKAIKKGSGSEAETYEEFTLEGYGPQGVAIIVECMTENPNRTIAHVRSWFSKYDGALGKNGSVSYLFSRKGVFVFPAQGLDEESLMLELIDHGLEDLERSEDQFVATCRFENFGALNARLEALSLDAETSLEQIPATYVSPDPALLTPLFKLFELLEEDDDIQNFYHNLEVTPDIAALMP
ncbi:MAG: YebC/PmpR family DNA-binding transcriptional regulator [Bacteroidia bacterium]|nr:YebC/PmpR family DNA-binding transcriptional regulator [Bacteroidia bacterium]